MLTSKLFIKTRDAGTDVGQGEAIKDLRVKETYIK